MVGFMELAPGVAMATYDMITDILYYATTEFCEDTISAFCLLFLILNPYMQLGYTIHAIVVKKMKDKGPYEDNICSTLFSAVFPFFDIMKLCKLGAESEDIAVIIFSPVLGQMKLLPLFKNVVGSDNTAVKTTSGFIEALVESFPQLVVQWLNNNECETWGFVAMLSTVSSVASLVFGIVSSINYFRDPVKVVPETSGAGEIVQEALETDADEGDVFMGFLYICLGLANAGVYMAFGIYCEEYADIYWLAGTFWYYTIIAVVYAIACGCIFSVIGFLMYKNVGKDGLLICLILMIGAWIVLISIAGSYLWPDQNAVSERLDNCICTSNDYTNDLLLDDFGYNIKTAYENMDKSFQEKGTFFQTGGICAGKTKIGECPIDVQAKLINGNKRKRERIMAVMEKLETDYKCAGLCTMAQQLYFMPKTSKQVPSSTCNDELIDYYKEATSYGNQASLAMLIVDIIALAIPTAWLFYKACSGESPDETKNENEVQNYRY